MSGFNLAKIEARLKQIPQEFEGKIVQVGFPTNAQYEDGTPIASIAIIHEFGAPEAHIPPRPFFGPSIAEHKADWIAAVKKVVKIAAQNDLSAEDALDGVGVLMSAQIQETIANIYDPALAESTLAARERRGNGSTKPLIDTGAMYDAVTYAVNDEGAEFTK